MYQRISLTMTKKNKILSNNENNEFFLLFLFENVFQSINSCNSRLHVHASVNCVRLWACSATFGKVCWEMDRPICQQASTNGHLMNPSRQLICQCVTDKQVIEPVKLLLIAQHTQLYPSRGIYLFIFSSMHATISSQLEASY